MKNGSKRTKRGLITPALINSGLILCTSGLALVQFSACNKIADKLVERTENAIKAEAVAAAAKMEQVAAEPAADPAALRDEQLADKLSHYIECLNSLSRGVFSSRERYLSWASKDGVTGKERNVYGLYELSDPKYCFKDLAEAKAKPPALPEIEQAAVKYEAAFQALQAKTQPAYAYYDQNDYKDDKFAKGKNARAFVGGVFRVRGSECHIRKVGRDDERRGGRA